MTEDKLVPEERIREETTGQEAQPEEQHVSVFPKKQDTAAPAKAVSSSVCQFLFLMDGIVILHPKLKIWLEVMD